MRNKLLYVVLLFSLFLSQSCSQEQSLSIESQIARVWNYDSEIGSANIDSATFLILTKNENEQTFVWSSVRSL